jgi:hypothetical protein
VGERRPNPRAQLVRGGVPLEALQLLREARVGEGDLAAGANEVDGLPEGEPVDADEVGCGGACVVWWFWFWGEGDWGMSCVMFGRSANLGVWEWWSVWWGERPWRRCAYRRRPWRSG